MPEMGAPFEGKVEAITKFGGPAMAAGYLEAFQT